MALVVSVNLDQRLTRQRGQIVDVEMFVAEQGGPVPGGLQAIVDQVAVALGLSGLSDQTLVTVFAAAAAAVLQGLRAHPGPPAG